MKNILGGTYLATDLISRHQGSYKQVSYSKQHLVQSLSGHSYKCTKLSIYQQHNQHTHAHTICARVSTHTYTTHTTHTHAHNIQHTHMHKHTHIRPNIKELSAFTFLSCSLLHSMTIALDLNSQIILQKSFTVFFIGHCVAMKALRALYPCSIININNIATIIFIIACVLVLTSMKLALM